MSRRRIRVAAVPFQAILLLVLFSCAGCVQQQSAETDGRNTVRLHLGTIQTDGPPEPPLGEAHAILTLAQTVTVKKDVRHIEVQWFNEFPSGTTSLNKLFYDRTARRLRHYTSRSVRAFVYDQVTPDKLKQMASSGARRVKELTGLNCPTSRL